MQIDVDSPEHGLKGSMVLKLFDRRFAPNLRSNYKISPWTSSIEGQYSAFVESGEIWGFIASLDDGDDDDWDDPAKDEAFLYDRCRRIFLIYPNLSTNFLDVSGIVLEYIDGFQPSKDASHIPKESWQSIGDDAVKIVELFGDRGILNEDVKARNFIVRKNMEKNAYEVFMIDFSYCVFRESMQTDEGWRKAKRLEDENGSVGATVSCLRGSREALYINGLSGIGVIAIRNIMKLNNGKCQNLNLPD